MKDISGQISIFDFTPSKQEKIKLKPGDYVERHGRQLTFDEIASMIGELIVMNKSTCSHDWFEVVMVEKIVEHEGSRRLIYYDGSHQRGYVNEIYFKETNRWGTRAWLLGDESDSAEAEEALKKAGGENE